MRLRRILIMLDGGECDDALLGQALGLCEAHEARLDALFVRRNAASGGDFLGDAFSTYGVEGVLEALDDAAALASERAHASFNTLADGASPDRIGRFIEFIGLPRAAMAIEGRISDLILVAKPDGAELQNKLNGIEAAACQSGRPILVLPESREAGSGFGRIVIAWDGSLEAARAVIGAMPILQAADAVLLLHAGIDDGSAEQLADMAQYLAVHRVRAETRSVSLDDRSPARALIETSTAEGADLLVMGAFGAPGWQRSIGRDDTTALLKGTPFAILLAH